MIVKHGDMLRCVSQILFSNCVCIECNQHIVIMSDIKLTPLLSGNVVCSMLITLVGSGICEITWNADSKFQHLGFGTWFERV